MPPFLSQKMLEVRFSFRSSVQKDLIPNWEIRQIKLKARHSKSWREYCSETKIVCHQTLLCRFFNSRWKTSHYRRSDAKSCKVEDFPGSGRKGRNTRANSRLPRALQELVKPIISAIFEDRSLSINQGPHESQGCRVNRSISIKKLNASHRLCLKGNSSRQVQLTLDSEFVWLRPEYFRFCVLILR